MIFQMANFKGSKAEGRHGVERAGRGRDFRVGRGFRVIKVVKVVKVVKDTRDPNDLKDFRDFKGPVNFKGSFDGAPGRGGQ